jgi:epoxyqueuosine reductase
MQFTYRNPDRSTDPQSALPGAEALVVGARRYERGADDETDPGRPHGRVAMYSWTDHYRPLRAALTVVADHLVQAGWRARVLADDNALVDRAAAVRAGLGWYGKNTNVLLPGAGSWFVLGSVVTDAPLAATQLQPQVAQSEVAESEVVEPEVATDGCRACQRCLAACPTGALVSPGQLDARRCLAWLVQAPGVFPRPYRAALGDRLYGCDECQTTCPINQLATRRRAPPAAEPGAQTKVDILWVLSASDVELMEALGRWYIPGRQPRYLRRNALIVLGNIGDPTDASTVDALVQALRHPDPLLRAHGAWAADRLGRSDLLEALGSDRDPLVVAELAAIGRAGR